MPNSHASHRGFAFASLLLALAACSRPAYVPDEIAEPTLPTAVYRDAQERGLVVYRVDPLRSRVFVHVGRSGAMKSAGHDHVISSQDVEGLLMIADDPAASRADLRIPLQRLIVDDPEFRSRFGLEADVSESAINGTTSNMQDKVLESRDYPWAEVYAQIVSMDADMTTLGVSVTLHGSTSDYVVPVDLHVEPDSVTVSGKMVIAHDDFGLTPFSALGGLLRVAQEIQLEFEILAARAAGPV